MRVSEATESQCHGVQLGLKDFFIASVSFNTGYTGNEGSRIRKTVLLASESLFFRLLFII